MKLICDVCGSENVCMSAQIAWDFDNNCWKSNRGEEWITFEMKDDKLVEVDRKGFNGLSQQDIIKNIKSNINDFDIDFGCDECEEIVNPEYDGLTDEIEIFNKLTQ